MHLFTRYKSFLEMRSIMLLAFGIGNREHSRAKQLCKYCGDGGNCMHGKATYYCKDSYPLTLSFLNTKPKYQLPQPQPASFVLIRVLFLEEAHLTRKEEGDWSGHAFIQYDVSEVT
jgi:hypothetical protein